MSPTRLVLMRHGRTAWNLEGRYQGQADPPLDAVGRAQAVALALALQRAGLRLDALYASPLLRARQTALPVAARLGLRPRWEPRLMEIHLGAWQGLAVADIRARWPRVFARWEADPWGTEIPGGERLCQVQARVYAALDAIVARHPAATVGLVAHHIPLALVKVRYQGLPACQVRRIPVPNARWEVVVAPAAVA